MVVGGSANAATETAILRIEAAAMAVVIEIDLEGASLHRPHKQLLWRAPYRHLELVMNQVHGRATKVVALQLLLSAQPASMDSLTRVRIRRENGTWLKQLLVAS